MGARRRWPVHGHVCTVWRGRWGGGRARSGMRARLFCKAKCSRRRRPFNKEKHCFSMCRFSNVLPLNLGQCFGCGNMVCMSGDTVALGRRRMLALRVLGHLGPVSEAAKCRLSPRECPGASEGLALPPRDPRGRRHRKTLAAATQVRSTSPVSNKRPESTVRETTASDVSPATWQQAPPTRPSGVHGMLCGRARVLPQRPSWCEGHISALSTNVC